MVSLEFMPDKLNPIIKPLMESIKKESIQQLQSLSAAKLVLFLDLCVKNKTPNPAEKVTRNLIHFAYSMPEDILDQGILSLRLEDIEAIQVQFTLFQKIKFRFL